RSRRSIPVLTTCPPRRSSDLMTTHAAFKRDIAARLAHKAPYNTPTFTHDKQIDLLIVVDQMLTGFDSKWLNTLYLDKVIAYNEQDRKSTRLNSSHVSISSAVF